MLIAFLYLLAMPIEVTSPDGHVIVRLKAAPDSETTWSVSYRGRPVLRESALGLELDRPLGARMSVEGVRRAARSASWKPPYGERAVIPENYREAVVSLKEPGAAGRRLWIWLRAYNEGAALRYTVPGAGELVVNSEQTEFALPEGAMAWETYRAQSPYRRVPVAEIKPNCERPLTVELPGGAWASIFEAGVRDYSRMLLSPAPGKPGTLVSTYGAFPVVGDERARSTKVWASAPLTTPWRGVLLGDRAGDLAERNYLLLNLSPPSAIADTSWIKPGKVIREATLSTRGGKECVDFAVRHNLQYVEYDAGWYGHEYDDASDATGVNVDPQRLNKDPAYQGLDLLEVIRYAREKGIGILLYVNRRALEKQRDTVFPLFEKWGVRGIKFGFVNVGSQYWTKWLYDSVAAAARHRLVVDVHDEFRPTGMSRTYPNLLTQEGIAGNETMPDAEHNTIMPFTRLVAGAGDYTMCYFSPRIRTTRAMQLALAVVYYSPLQFLYWYDRPSAERGEPELEFWDRVKTVWDDTRVLDGRPGEFAVTARRSGDEWFVGAITNGPRAIAVPLAFLPKGKRFRARIYENGAGKNDVRIRTLTVDAAGVIHAHLPAAGGQAIWLSTAEPGSGR